MNVALNERLAMQGGLLIPPHMRGRGLAKYLYFLGKDHLGHDRNILGDALEGMEETYSRWKTPIQTYTQHSYCGVINPDMVDALMDIAGKCDERIVNLKEVDFGAVVKYDKSIHPSSLPRTAYLKAFIEKDHCHSYVALNKVNQSIEGYAASCNIQTRYFVGPVYGNNSQVGISLLCKGLCHAQNRGQVKLLFPDNNQEGIKFITDLGFKVDGKATRIHTKEAIVMPLKKIFAGTLMSYIGLLLS